MRQPIAVQTPTQAEAQAHYARQQQIATSAVLATRPLFVNKAPLPQIANVIAAYQYASAAASTASVARWSGGQQQTTAEAFAGISSEGYSILEPVIATIDRRDPAPAEAVPAPWWSDTTLFQHAVELLIASEVADAGRSAGQVEATGQGWTSYVRVLTPPSCPRCAVLAGRVYRYSTGFQRHPGCDCVMVPTDDSRASNHLLADPAEAIRNGHVRGLSKADYRAIVEDGADPAKVINAVRGTSVPGITTARSVTVDGQRLKATTAETTKRAAWRKAHPSTLLRLRPEAIYKIADDRADALRLLKFYGYS